MPLGPFWHAVAGAYCPCPAPMRKTSGSPFPPTPLGRFRSLFDVDSDFSRSGPRGHCASERHREAVEAAGPRGGHDRRRGGPPHLRVRRADRLSLPAARRRAARHHRGGVGDPALLQREPRQGRAARRGHLALRRRVAARGRDRALPVAHAEGPCHRHGQPRGPRRSRRHQHRHHRGGVEGRLLLRARPVEPDRLHRRRQHRHQFRRRPLSQIRRDREQRARAAHGHDGRRDRRHRRHLSRCAGLRLPAAHHRLRGPARRRHRSHGALAESAGRIAADAARLRLHGGGRVLRCRHHRRRHHSRGHRVHGPPGDPCLRALRQRRLPARRRGAAHRRGGGVARRDRVSAREDRGHRRATSSPATRGGA